jgi:hypothetical protein
MKHPLDGVQVGDHITLINSDGVPRWIRKVTHVTKTTVVDATGDRWTRRGFLWGEKERCFCSTARRTVPGDAAAIDGVAEQAYKRRLANALRVHRFEREPIEVLRKIADLVGVEVPK